MLFYYGISDHIETAVAAIGTSLSLLLPIRPLVLVRLREGEFSWGKSPLRTLLWGALASFVWSAVIGTVIAASIRLVGPPGSGVCRRNRLVLGFLHHLRRLHCGWLEISRPGRLPSARPSASRQRSGFTASCCLRCFGLNSTHRTTLTWSRRRAPYYRRTHPPHSGQGASFFARRGRASGLHPGTGSSA